MDEQAVREHAQAHCDALLAGDMTRAVEQLSPELRANLGPVVAMLPMPLTSASVESVERTGTGVRAVLHLVGESDEIRLETRWKDRDGTPTMVGASHLAEDGAPESTSSAEETPEAGTSGR